MKTFRYVMNSPYGIHARPASKIFELCSLFESQIVFNCNNQSANAKNIMDLLSLRASKGDELTVNIYGRDEVVAYQNLQSLLFSL